MPEEGGKLALIGERPDGWMVKRGAPNPSITLDDYLSYFNYGGIGYPYIQRSTLGQHEEWPNPSYSGYAQGLLKSNGIVFACMLKRLQVFSEARFQFQRMRGGRPGDLYGNQSLNILERPWPNGVTGDLLARSIQDADLDGNAFWLSRFYRLIRLRPDWVTLVVGSHADPEARVWDLDADLLGYIYQPNGPASEAEPEVLDVSEVAHFAPIPDPEFRFRGMSWLVPIIQEVMADRAMTTHKQQFFVNGATPNMVVSLDPTITKEKFQQWVDKFEEKHTGVLNAYRTLYLGGGAKAEVVGANLQQIDFKVTQGAGETRIAAAAGVPPVLVGLSEGLAAATYSNYAQARRAFADMTVRPLWRNLAGSLSTVITVPSDSRLWYDDRDIPFLREDAQIAAEVKKTEASTIQTLIVSGFKPESVVAAVTAQDYSLLEHTGLYSVQLQPPQPEGPPQPEAAPAQPANGKPAPPAKGPAIAVPSGKGQG